MIKDPEVAVAISQALHRAYSELDESARLVREQGNEEETKAYLGAVGNVLYELIFRLMEPLYTEHPTLAPANWNQDATPSPHSS